MTDRTGRCLCGKVQFKLSAEPQMARVCWCRDCQHLASNGTVNALVPADALSDYALYGEFVTSRGAVKGNWSVTFPLENTPGE